MPSELASNVLRGTARLMEEDTEFFLKINPDYFSIQNIRCCAVGQFFAPEFEYDPYRKGLRRLDIEEKDAYRYGFDAHDDYYDACDWGTLRYRIAVLNRMWSYLIRQARERHACMQRHPSYKGK